MPITSRLGRQRQIKTKKEVLSSRPEWGLQSQHSGGRGRGGGICEFKENLVYLYREFQDNNETLSQKRFFLISIELEGAERMAERLRALAAPPERTGVEIPASTW